MRRTLVKAIANRWDAAFKHTLLIVVVLRVSLSLIAAMALYQFPLYHVTYYHGVPPVPPGIADLLLGVWQRFDTIWYTKIAMQGYAKGDGTTVFFPLYPLLTRFVGYVTSGNYLLAGIIVSNLACFLALVYLYKLTELEFDSQVALRTLIYLSLFPTAFFLLGAYTESPFLLFAVSAFYYARRGRWLPASIMGLLAALTKQLGLLLLPPLLYEYLAGRGFKLRSIRWDVLFLLLIPLGTLAFLLFRHFYIGGPLSVVGTYRTQWAVHAAWPWENIFDSLMAILDTARFPPLNPEDTFSRRVFYNSLDLACVGLFVFLSFASLRRLRLSYSLYMFSVLFVVLLQRFRPPYPIPALPRYVLVLFPAFMLLASMVRNRALHWVIWYFSAMLLSLFTAMFATWRIVA
ncbi:MAG: glycosyltransferase family 39 protein [Dehalococcoidia bacterium]